ncbi:MAG: O-antigen polymerase [Clostridium sp.]
MALKILIVALGLTLSTYLFKKAAGTLSIRKLNLISYTFYLFILQTYIGTSLVFLGDREHYTINYILNNNTIPRTFFYVLLTAMLFPLIIVMLYKIFKIDMDDIYNNYLSDKTRTDNEQIVFYIVLGISSISIILMIMLFAKIGYVPLLKMVFAEPGFNFKTARINISNVTIIHQYVKNILVLSLIPVFSYISFVYAYTTKKLRWILLFITLLICSVFTKTYNFAKTPVIFYLFTFVIIYIMLNNGIKRKYLYIIIGFLGGLILVFYKVMGYVLEFSIHTGPISRVIFTQAGTLMYHFDFFPGHFPFLMGRSLASTILKVIGSNLTPLRSAKLIMAFYGSRSVYEGTAGVMNSLFIGEAYANFGTIGVILSIIYVAVLFGVIYYLFTKKFRKTALNVALFGILTSELASITQGGFFDFVYNANILVIILLFIFISYSSKWISLYLEKRKVTEVKK